MNDDTTAAREAAARALDNLAECVALGLAAAGGLDWLDDAACGQSDDVDMSWFFRHGAPSKETKAMCAACPVAVQCDAYATGAGIGHGLFGGKGPTSRGYSPGTNFAAARKAARSVSAPPPAQDQDTTPTTRGETR